MTMIQVTLVSLQFQWVAVATTYIQVSWHDSHNVITSKWQHNLCLPSMSCCILARIAHVRDNQLITTRSCAYESSNAPVASLKPVPKAPAPSIGPEGVERCRFIGVTIPLSLKVPRGVSTISMGGAMQQAVPEVMIFHSCRILTNMVKPIVSRYDRVPTQHHASTGRDETIQACQAPWEVCDSVPACILPTEVASVMPSEHKATSDGTSPNKQECMCSSIWPLASLVEIRSNLLTVNLSTMICKKAITSLIR